MSKSELRIDFLSPITFIVRVAVQMLKFQSQSRSVTCAPQFICGTTQSSIVGCCQTTTGKALCADVVTTCYDFLGASCDLAC
jgi:hypothetical protein